VAGSLSEAISIISSVDPGGLGTMATGFRGLGSAAVQAGSTLTGSAADVGAQHGEPYAAYEARLAPVGGWLQQVQGPITETAAQLDNAKTVSERAQWVMAQVLAALARYGASQTNPAAAGAAMAAAEAQALAQLNPEIEKMSAAFAAIQPMDPGTAPVQNGGGGGTGTSDSSSSSAGQAGTVPAGSGTVSSGAVGPQSGPYAGWVQDPTTGNLVDPATGREVDAGGRFVDPVTGEPFGDPSEYASRLEGLQGGVGPAGGGPAGLPPAPTGIGPATGTGMGAIAGYYGGMIPPSLAGPNPAASQLRQKAKENLELRADTAQRYAAIATGQGQSQGGHPYAYMPPMAGMGAVPPGAGARRGRTTRHGKAMVTEPASVWGATGRGARGKPREKSGGTELVEDADVWTGQTAAGSGVLGGR
jgi:hypothetical protein